MITLLITLYCQPFADIQYCKQEVTACYEKYLELYPSMNSEKVIELCVGDFEESER
jgi:hypothetical protein